MCLPAGIEYRVRVRRTFPAIVARLLLGSVVVAAGCTGPARAHENYRLKARSSARSALSAVSTSQLVAMLVREKRAFARYESVVSTRPNVMRRAPNQAFASIQPPDAASDQLRTGLGGVERHGRRDLVDADRGAASRPERAARRSGSASEAREGIAEVSGPSLANVDDIHLAFDEDGRPYVDALLCGPGA